MITKPSKNNTLLTKSRSSIWQLDYNQTSMRRSVSAVDTLDVTHNRDVSVDCASSVEKVYYRYPMRYFWTYVCVRTYKRRTMGTVVSKTIRSFPDAYSERTIYVSNHVPWKAPFTVEKRGTSLLLHVFVRLKPATGRPYVTAFSLSGRKFDLCVSASSRTTFSFGNNVSCSSSVCSTQAAFCRR